MDPQTVSRSALEERTSSSDVPSHQTDQPWTDEKHVRFLNSMEAWFVRTMLGDTSRLLRLDRYLPDSSESTLDSKLILASKKNHATSVNFMGTRSTLINGRADMRLRGPSPSQPHDSSEDQVVPQMEKQKRS
ncbi:hypothetical protein SLEP1_g17052 [Rubroshorea leprosula]|uniref:Uncharacterized protein n=1 Tax=Rubroshorea leprosula TaxID=152421 RepID=A0AAV5J3E2_9ROSI|nr:hypothetical protein SLEP1_g17052 [Rubroshorea leprosula]